MNKFDSPPICSFCSLLCSTTDSQKDFGATFCSRRNRELEWMRGWIDSTGNQSDAAAWELAMRQAKTQLERSESVLVTGRIHEVETARGAVRVAKQFNATLDGWESEPSFDAILSMQRNGQYAVSLAEARSLSTLLLVIGDDSLLEDYPRMPMALSGGNSIPVLLLGSWSDGARKAWQDAGFQVLAIESSIESIPKSLAQSKSAAQEMDWDSLAGTWLQQSQYTTVLFSMRHLNLRYGDLWYDALMQWIALRNEDLRCGALSWGGLEVSLQQVCTWLTGFPGRVRYQTGNIEYDPYRHIASQWILNRDCIDRPVASSTILWIDDTTDDVPPPILESGLPVIVIATKRPRAVGPSVIWLPSQRAGIDALGQFFRGDQAVLVRGRDPIVCARTMPGAYEWLRGLCEL